MRFLSRRRENDEEKEKKKRAEKGPEKKSRTLCKPCPVSVSL